MTRLANKPSAFVQAASEQLGLLDTSGPTWLQEHRRVAAERFVERGLPSPRDEAWRFTPIAPIRDADFAPARSEEVPSYLDEAIAGFAAAHVFIGDGDLVSVRDLPEGVTVQAFSVADEQANSELRSFEELQRNSNAFEDLNHALAQPVVVRIAKNVRLTEPFVIAQAAGEHEERTACHPRVVLVVEQNAQASVVEHFVGGPRITQLTNALTEVALAVNASLEHVRVQHGNDKGLHMGNLVVRQSRDSRYRSTVLSLGGKLTRVDIHVALGGSGACCELDGLYLVSDGQHVDYHTLIDHLEPNCQSAENYRGILSGGGTGVFDGTIVVRRHAQKTVAKQENRNLLLSDRATVHTKPHLQIDADDVKCAHGATVGQLDPAQLFYLRARGIGRDQASRMLTSAFAQSVMACVEDDSLRASLETKIENWLVTDQVSRGAL